MISEMRSLYRILDANFNRAKEGLRVCEDICRFVLDKKGLTRSYKDVRHRLTDVMVSLKIQEFIKARNVVKDVGKPSTAMEFQRKEMKDVFYANSQRVKESIRVLEEFLKLKNKTSAQELKTLRYTIYGLEQKVIKAM
ncbi:hypothetical protein MNBD_UNCLBAC01-1498 [hydrothermal vent metagenome]|uniref:ThiD2 domain-containing protein n=1 Tax=hydrothermal vent metagenome TaxID=652676 RepID=A0A3B1DP02_9ZZZZ